MNVLPFEKKVSVVSCLVEGCSIRATERMLSVHRDTIMRLGVEVGEGCKNLHDHRMRRVQSAIIEVDEVWSFVYKKQKRRGPMDPDDFGDCYTFLAIDSVDKAILSCVVGKRDGLSAHALADDLSDRVLNRPQINTDAFPAYPEAFQEAFGAAVDHAVVSKDYDAPAGQTEASRRYSPGRIRSTRKMAALGSPDLEVASTSYIERQNLTARMQMRRFTRLTNGFSKKSRNHEAAVWLYVAWYNFCRVHETLRVTPAMAIGITDHVWSIADLIVAAMTSPAGPASPRGGEESVNPPLSRAAVGGAVYPYRTARPTLRVIRGGLS